ncbi:MAG: M3 family metallopeptidase [Alphaproteobacteria bacterium]|nr:M3 family metallopeptidase [Alphaproteobacteria bacterium]MDE2336411.1 M3 family metallopeptidase [Alphaproteobacteria bacterium]
MTAPFDSAADNPLLAEPALPHGALPLDQLKPEYFLPAITAGIAAAKKEIDAIKANPAAPTFENTIEALEFSGATLGRVANMFSCVAGANGDDALRQIKPAVYVTLARHGNDIMMDAALFARVKAVYDQRAALKLDAEQKMLLEETYKGFVEKGALLSAADKKEMADIDERLSELGTIFDDNTVKSTDAYEKVIGDEKDLDGVSERAKNSYRHAAEEAGMTGKWLIKLSPPPMDILDSCKNRALREEIWRAMNSVASEAPHDNHPVVLEIVKLRHRQAEIMGYKSYAAYKLDDTMAKTPQAVMDLLEKNLNVYKPATEKFLDKVKDYAQQQDGLKDLKPWDYAYYSRKLKEETFKLDLEDLRPYFDLEKVLDGVRIHAEKLFNIKMTEVKGKYPVYHPDVKTFEVTDNKTGQMIGIFYGDYYARPGAKGDGAWMDTLRKRGLDKAGGQNEFSLVFNVCNFSKPTKNQPTLLSLDEVRTTFHEFGHALHALLAEGNYRSLTCTSVKHDFVEVPSQLLENWAVEKEVLDTFAIHHDTQQPLPAALIKKINDMETFDAAYAGLRQTFFGLLDMKWHTTDPAAIKDAETLEDEIVAKASAFPRLASPMSTRFGHLFAGGYAAGYYGYKWAEALEADIFTAFKKNGLYDRKTADRLRETVYSKGGTVEAETLFEDMMGRKPDPNALHRREGLLPPEDDKKPAKPASKKPPKP